MKLNKDIFKAYDIRGIYDIDIDDQAAYILGQEIARELDAGKISVGRDARLSGPALYNALIQGILDMGVDVVALDLVTTPMLYFSSHKLNVDGAIAVTASHNPGEYNGVKVCRKNAVPVGGATGLNIIRDATLARIDENPQVPTGAKSTKGTLTHVDIKPDYYEFFSTFAKFNGKKFNIVIDAANTMGYFELPFYMDSKYLGDSFAVTQLYCDIDNAYTGSHEANPLNTETLDELRARVLSENADLGIAYDGDADRVGFIDEKGEIIPMDLATGLIAKTLLHNKKPEDSNVILYDLRSSRSVREVIEEAGGVAHECRVGHAFIKQQMVEYNALFAGELSGHYYYNANKNGEVSTLAVITLLNLMAETGQPLSELVKDLRRYHHSGEINSTVTDKDAVITKLKEVYKDGIYSDMDGIKIDYKDWWFNVRASNTEPLLRLNLEANTKELMEEKRDELMAIIKGSQ